MPRPWVLRNHLKPEKTYTQLHLTQAFIYLALFFAIHELSDHQQQAITALFCGSNVLALLPTGSGKTITFWGLLGAADYLFNGSLLNADRVLSSATNFVRPLLVVIR